LSRRLLVVGSGGAVAVDFLKFRVDDIVM